MKRIKWMTFIRNVYEHLRSALFAWTFYSFIYLFEILVLFFLKLWFTSEVSFCMVTLSFSSKLLISLIYPFIPHLSLCFFFSTFPPIPQASEILYIGPVKGKAHCFSGFLHCFLHLLSPQLEQSADHCWPWEIPGSGHLTLCFSWWGSQDELCPNTAFPYIPLSVVKIVLLCPKIELKVGIKDWKVRSRSYPANAAWYYYYYYF